MVSSCSAEQPERRRHAAENREGPKPDRAEHPLQHLGLQLGEFDTDLPQPQIQVFPGDDGVFVGKPAASSRWASFNVSKATEFMASNHA